MSSNRDFQRLAGFLFWVLLLLIAILIPALLNNNLWIQIAASVPLLLRVAYDYQDRFNLVVNRLILWMFNRDVAWEMTARFTGHFAGADIDSILRNIQQTKTIQVIQTDDYSKTFSLPEIGMVIKLSLGQVRTKEDEFTTELALAVQRVFVSFQHSTRSLNSLISIINDAVRKSIDIQSEKYEFKAFFVTNNPYFGLFLRRLKVVGIPQVNIEYHEKEGANDGQVKVTADKISLVTKDIQSLQSLSRKYITLSSLNLSET